MFATGVRQARFGLCTVLGRPVKVETVEGLVRDALATLVEFGAPGDDVAAILDGPYADPSLAAELRTKALRRTARRLDARSAFYRKRFAKAGVDPRRLTTEELAAVPVTDRGDLVDPEEFLCGEPFLSSSTTGTTGRPAQIWFSSREMRLWPAM